MVPIMGTRAVERGPTSERVAANVKAVRVERRLTLGQLAERMTELGRPVLKSGLSKLEQGQRRVDVDELVALALALEVTPNRLLLDAVADDEPIRLTEAYETNRAQAWAWSCGEWVEGSRFPFTRFTGDRLPLFRFQTETRPHDPPRALSVEEWAAMDKWREALADVYWAMRDDDDAPEWLFNELMKGHSGRVSFRGAPARERADDGER